MIYLFSYSQNIKIEEIAEKLNDVEPSINFNYEKESNNTIPFLDIVIIKSHYNLTFNVYHKPTNKSNYIHFYSHHNSKIKTGLIIGFYLRALWICCPQCLDEEFWVHWTLPQKPKIHTYIYIYWERERNGNPTICVYKKTIYSKDVFINKWIIC